MREIELWVIQILKFTDTEMFKKIYDNMEIFTRELESIVKREGVGEGIPTEKSSPPPKKNYTHKKNTIVEIKNKIDGVKIRLSIAEQIISELEPGK